LEGTGVRVLESKLAILSGSWHVGSGHLVGAGLTGPTGPAGPTGPTGPTGPAGGGGGGGAAGTGQNHNVAIFTGNNTLTTGKLVYLPTERLGVNTLTPQHTLDVAGTISGEAVRGENVYLDGASFRKTAVSGSNSFDPTVRVYQCDTFGKDNVVYIHETDDWNDINVYLPTPTNGREIYVKVSSNTIGTVYVKTFGNLSTIDGSSNLQLSAGTTAHVICIEITPGAGTWINLGTSF